MARTHEQYDLKVEDRKALESLLRPPKTAQSLVSRAKVILFTADGKTADEVSVTLGATTRSVNRWRKSFKNHGLEGLHDRPRSGQPKKLSEKVVKEVLRLSVGCIPREATH